VTLRDRTEWVETVEAGWNVTAGNDEEAIVEAARRLTAATPPPPRETPYGDGCAAEAIVGRLLEAV
jgi:UDP-N-acetylglucosamine 2-epimerase (non-hydrolysing)